MKRIIFILLFCFSHVAYSQNRQNCYHSISNFEFQKLKNAVMAERVEIKMLVMAKQFASSNCLSTIQVKELLNLFSNDFNRLEVAVASFINITDKDNYYDIYDSFAYFSTAMRFFDFVNTYKMNHSKNDDRNDNRDNRDIDFPNLNYPSIENYRGKVNCELPLSDNDFRRKLDHIKNERNENNRFAILVQFVKSNCVTTAQVMKLSTFLEIEMNRLNFAKEAFFKVYDVENYKAVTDIFSNRPYKRELIEFIENQSRHHRTEIVPECIVSEQDMVQIKKTIENGRFDNTKISISKQIFKDKKCFSVNQIIEILKLFSFEDSKFDLAKYAYDYCVDRSNYYLVNNVFSFASTKESMTQYVQSRK